MFIEDIEVNHDFEQEDYNEGTQTTSFDWSSDDERLGPGARGRYYGSIECFWSKCVILNFLIKK